MRKRGYLDYSNTSSYPKHCFQNSWFLVPLPNINQKLLKQATGGRWGSKVHGPSERSQFRLAHHVCVPIVAVNWSQSFMFRNGCYHGVHNIPEWNTNCKVPMRHTRAVPKVQGPFINKLYEEQKDEIPYWQVQVPCLWQD